MAGRSTCTRCAATLPAADLDGNQVCISCGLFHTSDPAATDPRPPLPPVPPPSTAGPFGAGGTTGAAFGSTVGTAPGAGPIPPPQHVAAPPSRKKGRGGTIGCLVAVVIVIGLSAALVGGLVWVVRAVGDADETGSGQSEVLPLAGEIEVLPRDGAAGQVVALATRRGSAERTVVLADLDEGGGGVVWDAPLVPDGIYQADFVATDDLVVATLGTQVVGLDRASGATAWQVELPDVLSPSCTGCLVAVGDHVVAFTADAQVTVIDPSDGSVPWSRRLESAQGRIAAFGDRLLVVDEADDGPVTVTLTEVADGAAVASHSPSCPDPVFEGSTLDAPTTTHLERVPGTDDVVAQFAFGRTCTTRWEATTGTVRWERALEQSIAHDASVAITATDMITASSSGLIHVALAEGTVSHVTAPADVALSGPAWLSGTTALVSGATTRGTPAPVIVAVDVRSREILWTSDLPRGGEPLVVDDIFGITLVPGRSAHLLVPGDESASLVTVEEGGRLTVSDVDLVTGRTEIVGTDAVVGPDSGTPTVYLESVDGDGVVFSVDGAVHVVDLAAGTVAASWGGG